MNTHCAKCGTKGLEGAAYCIVCGTPVDGDGTPRPVKRTQHTAPDSEMYTSTTFAAGVHQPTPVEPTEPTLNKDKSPREDRAKPYGVSRVLRSVFYPFVWVERKIVEPLAAWLSRLALLDVLEYIGKFAILVVALYWLYEEPARDRQEHYEAWRVINSAKGQEGTGGRIDALENLYQDQQSLAGLTAPNANLEGVELYEEGEAGAQIDNAILGEANLEGADLYRADLSGADLHEAKLKDADLGGRADLRRADLRGANLEGTKLAEADFSNGLYAGQTANLDRAVLDDAKLNGADLRGVSFEDASLWKAELEGAKLQEANFTRATLSNAKLQGAHLKGAYFLDTLVYGANLEGTDITQDQLEGMLGDSSTKFPSRDPDGNPLEEPERWQEETGYLAEGFRFKPQEGRQYSGNFQPTISFDAVESGWMVAEDESESWLSLKRVKQDQSEHNVTFLNADGVYDPEHPTADSSTPVPDNLVSWIEGHPHLEVTSKKSVSVGGVRGVRIDLTVPIAPEDYPMECSGPCVPLFRSSDNDRFWVYYQESARYYILDVGYDTVVVQDASLADDDLRDSAELLESVRFQDYSAATGQDFSGGFEPSLAFTVDDNGWWMADARPDQWTMTRGEREEAYLSFVRVDEVYDPQHPSDENISSAPADLVAWFEKHPRLEIEGGPKQVTVGSVRGVQLEVSVSSAAEDFCDACVPLFATGGGRYYELFTGYRNQLTILRVEGETVIIAAESPGRNFYDFRQQAQEVISSIKWNN